MRRHRSLALLVIAGLALAACAPQKAQDYGVSASGAPGVDAALQARGTETVDTSTYKKDGPYNIVALTQGPINGWGLTWDVSMQYEASQQKDVKNLTLVSSGGDSSKQISQMENAVKQKPDAIILVPMSYEALVAPAARAMAAGIPVIVCANHLQGDDYVSVVTQDLYASGYASAEALAKRLDGKGNVVMFSGIAGAYGAEIWKKAAEDLFKKYPDIKIVANEYADWSVATAKEKTAAILAANPQIDGVWSGGSEMALGALLSFKDAGRTLPVFGVANPINGWLRVTHDEKVEFDAYENPPGTLAVACVDTAMKVLHGEQVHKAELLPANHYDQTTAMEHYVPELNDDFVPPPTAPISAYVDAGMARK